MSITVNNVIYTLNLANGDASAKAESTNITTVDILNSVTDASDVVYTVTSIANSAFLQCTALTSVIIPDAVTSIGNNAFASCSGLTSVTIGANVTSISGAGVKHTILNNKYTIWNIYGRYVGSFKNVTS